MTNEKLFGLTEELLERVEIAKKEARLLKVNPEDKKFPFIHIGEKEYVNPKYLPFEYHCQFVQLFKFVRDYEGLKQEDLNKILSMCKTRFAVLINLNNVVENLVKEIRAHNDEKYISYMYFGLNKNKEEGIKV